MDFFAQQARIRRSSHHLVWLFAFAVLAIIIAVDLICAFVLGVGLRPLPLLGIAVAVVVVIGLCSAYRVASLAGGGAAVAREMNAVEVPADTTNPQWQRLRNVIEEIAIASGVPVPEIYVMQNESGINAFAAGYTPTDAAVCVTQGCLDKLSRDELQGVIAHEFSHVLNGDMRLNIRLMGLLFGIMALWVVGRFLMWGGFFGVGDDRDRRGGGGGQVALAGLALLIVGSIGVFFGRLIQAAVSRERESLADASAVQFTRQTSGIAGALKKIAAVVEGSALQNPRRDEVRHMLFGDAEQTSWFATHPPILERIKALEPGFKPEDLDVYVKQWLAAGGDPDSIDLHAGQPGWEKAAHDFARADGDVDVHAPHPGAIGGVVPAAGAAGTGAIGGVIPARGAELALTAGAVAAQVGSPVAHDYHAASQLHAQIPAALAAAARDPRGALAVIFALAISDHPDLKAQQLQAVTDAFDASLASATGSLVAQMDDLHPMLRLPLAQMAFPALKRRPRPEIGNLVKVLDALIHADGRVDLDEYCLAKLVQTQVVAALDPASSFKPGTTKLIDVQDELRDLAALVAHFGNDDDDSARRAFQAAMHEALPNAQAMYALPDDWQAALDRSLGALVRLAPEGKQLTVQALTRAIAADGKVSVAESEMLRTVCAVLGCPLPVVLGDHDAP
jgi:Zn-dependent protease with chaperone function